MIKRLLEYEIRPSLERTPSGALLGPRQVGKTTLALQISALRSSVYLDLENSLDLQKVSDILSFHQANRGKLIILDEIQRLPEVFPPIRGIIYRERQKGN